MTFFILIVLICFFNFVQSDQIMNDEEFYNKGVEFYDEGLFEESFTVFFNLSEKGYEDAIFNLSNMYFEGIGTVQNYEQSLKYTWLCALNGNKKCIKKIDIVKDKVSEKLIESVADKIPEILEKNFIEFDNPKSAFKLGYWHENFSPVVDLEKSYLWYSVSVIGGLYKAMKLRDRVGETIDNEKINELQKEAQQIHTKDKYFKKNETAEENI